MIARRKPASFVRKMKSSPTGGARRSRSSSRAASSGVAPLAEDDHHRSVKQRIGPYVVTGELGRGGMALVLRARDARLGREVAIKLLGRISAIAIERFRREAETLSRLDH